MSMRRSSSRPKYHEQNWQEVKSVWIIKVGVERANWSSAVGDSAQWGSMVEWKCTQRWKQAKGSTEVHWGPQSSLFGHIYWFVTYCSIRVRPAENVVSPQQPPNQISALVRHTSKILHHFSFSGSLANIVNVVTIVVVLGVNAKMTLIALEIWIWSKYEHGKSCDHWPPPIIENNSRPESFQN